jgi:glycyl-tRNA synthetase beta chain
MNIQPTGSQDPYALRRQALGIVHTILQHNLELSLKNLVREAYRLLREQVDFPLDADKTWDDIQAFFQQRMDNVLTETGIRYDVINAVLAGETDNLWVIKEKAFAISAFRESDRFRQLIAGFTRVANLAKNAVHSNVRAELFSYAEEGRLHQEFEQVRKLADGFLKEKDYQKALAQLSELSGAIDDFFTAVMVMVEDQAVKENRLALLKQIADYVKGIADLSGWWIKDL